MMFDALASRVSMMETPSLIAGALVIGTSFLALIRVLRISLENKKPFEKLPTPDFPSHWFWGHAKGLMAEDFAEAFKRLSVNNANEFGQVGFWFMRFKMLSVASLKDARTILSVEHERRPPKIAKHYVGHFIGEKNLLFLNGKEWK